MKCKKTNRPWLVYSTLSQIIFYLLPLNENVHSVADREEVVVLLLLVVGSCLVVYLIHRVENTNKQKAQVH